MRHPITSQSRSEQIIVLANRQPYRHQWSNNGELHAVRGSSGVVNAVEPLLLQEGGVWVAAAAGEADRHAIDRAGGLQVPPNAPRYRLRRVWLSEAEHRGYYDGFANGALWPLCHRTPVAPAFNPTEFGWYETVNRRFADVVADEALVPNPIVFAHDYHFALAPSMIRRRLPLSRIATFWHIPWPTPQMFDRCPWSTELIKGLLASTLIGFQTALDRLNFLRCAEAVGDIDWDENAVDIDGRRVQLGVYPASVEWPRPQRMPWPSITDCRLEVRQRLQITDETILGVGIDRLDYTKGLEEKFLAIECLLRNRPDLRGRFVFAQIAEPSRECLPAYQQTRERVVATANRINAEFAGHTPPIILLPRSHSQQAVMRFMRAADFCYVGSLHDGMNLVSKEFVAARDDEQGVLVLSGNAGSSHELRDALIVSPYDIEQVAQTLAAAIEMPRPQQELRMRKLRWIVAGWDARTWASQIVNDARSGIRHAVVSRDSVNLHTTSWRQFANT